MSQRETHIPSSLQQWRGVNQRQSPVRIPDGFFLNAYGTYFGIGENAERMPGKLLAGVVPSPVLQFFVLGPKVIIQTLNKVYMTDLTELLNLSLIDNLVVVNGVNVTVNGNLVSH